MGMTRVAERAREALHRATAGRAAPTGWAAVGLPAGTRGVLLLIDEGVAIESPGMDAGELHDHLLAAARASYRGAAGDAHALALDTALATWQTAQIFAAAQRIAADADDAEG